MVPRNRMPLYPQLQSLVYRPGMSREEFFAAGKTANAVLGRDQPPGGRGPGGQP